jgi:large subunit ribosomal protein L10
MAKIESKKPIVDEISAGIAGAKSLVLVDYRGLTVEQETRLRKDLREAGVVYKVYKNTLMNKAFQGTEFESLAPYLNGPSAIAYSTTDPVTPAKLLSQFAKTADKLKFKAGVVEGTMYDAKGMATVATIPGKEELLSRLLGSLQSPITNFARVLKQIAEKDGAPAGEAVVVAEEAVAVAEEAVAVAEEAVSVTEETVAAAEEAVEPA